MSATAQWVLAILGMLSFGLLLNAWIGGWKYALIDFWKFVFETLWCKGNLFRWSGKDL